MPLFHTYILHQSLHFVDCYSPSLRRFSQVSGSDCPLTDLLYISRFILLVSTVLRFASLLVPAGSDCPSSILIYCISRFTSLIVTVLLSAGFRKYRARIALLQTYYTSVASSYWFLQFFASQVWLVSGSDCPLSCLYCICRFNSLIVTVLLSAGFRQVLTGSDCPLPCLYCISRYNSLIVTVLLFAGFRKYRVQIVPSLRPIG